MLLKRLFCAAAISLLSVSAAQAAPIAIPIDQPAGAYSNPLVFGPMTVTSSGNLSPGPLEIQDANSLSVVELFVCGSFQYGRCAADVFLTFDAPISRLSFEAAQTSTLENFTVLAYADPNAVFGISPADFSTDWDSSADVGGSRKLIELDAGIDFTKVYIVNSTDRALFGNFLYEAAAPIPLPAGIWFGLTGLASFAGLRRLRRTRSF